MAIDPFLIIKSGAVAAQQAVAADGASRPQDRGVFEIWKRPNRFPDLLMRRR
jgi:hypothetical protein